MSKQHYVLKLSELFFYMFFSLILFAKGIGLYDGRKGMKIFLIAAGVAWICKMLLTEYDSLTEVLVYTVLIILAAMTCLISHEKGAFFCIMLICGMKNMDVRKVFKNGLIIWSISFGSMFVFTSLHIIPCTFKVHDRIGMGRIIRWGLGQPHPNVLHISYMVLACLIIYWIKDNMHWKALAFLMMGNLFVYMYSLSNTGFLVVTFLILLVTARKIRGHLSLFALGLSQICIPVCLLISFAAPVMLKGRAFDILNSALNTRLALSKFFLENQKMSLFGTDTSGIVTSTITMDNSYLYALVTYGVVFSIIIYCLYVITIYEMMRRDEEIPLIIVITCMLAGITEPFLFNTSFKNITLIFVGAELGRIFVGKSKRKIKIIKDKILDISVPGMKLCIDNILKAICLNRVKIMVISLSCAAVMAAMTYVTSDMPKRYILPRKAFEYTDDLPDSYYLKSQNDLPADGDKVLRYESSDTDMVAFSGNIAIVERFRNTVSVFIYGFILITFVGGVVVNMGVKKNERSE